MATSKTNKKKQPSAKDTLATQISVLLKPLHETLKSGLGEKKLEKRIKKAAKLLIHGLKTGEAKKTATKTPAKKAIKKKSIPVAAKKTAVPQKKKA